MTEKSGHPAAHISTATMLQLHNQQVNEKVMQCTCWWTCISYLYPPFAGQKLWKLNAFTYGKWTAFI